MPADARLEIRVTSALLATLDEVRLREGRRRRVPTPSRGAMVKMLIMRAAMGGSVEGLSEAPEASRMSPAELSGLVGGGEFGRDLEAPGPSMAIDDEIRASGVLDAPIPADEAGLPGVIEIGHES